MQDNNVFLFQTKVFMKDSNYWIVRDLITPKSIKAKDVTEALMVYAETVKNDHYVEISKTALTKGKQPMFQDYKDAPTRQVGYVITGFSEIQKRDNTWVKKAVELWIEILEVNNPFIEHDAA